MIFEKRQTRPQVPKHLQKFPAIEPQESKNRARNATMHGAQKLRKLAMVLDIEHMQSKEGLTIILRNMEDV